MQLPRARTAVTVVFLLLMFLLSAPPLWASESPSIDADGVLVSADDADQTLVEQAMSPSIEARKLRRGHKARGKMYRVRNRAAAVRTAGEVSTSCVQDLESLCSGIRARLKRMGVSGRRAANRLVCEPNYRVHVSTAPNDSSYSSQRNSYELIGAPDAWDSETGSSDTIAAVIDTGVEYTHPDLDGNMWTNPGEIADNGIDDDANGYVDDIHGYDFFNDDGDPMDDNGHGTHVAGIIGAEGNNGVGVTGVVWDVRIMAVKFLGSDGSGYTSDAVEAIEYAAANGAKVANNSWGGYGSSTALRTAICAASNMLVTAAAGNESNDNDSIPSYPASYDCSNVVAVAAVDNSDDLAYFSNYGSSRVDLAAPGVSILSTYMGSRYATLSGTSMATPFVTGAAALLFSYDSGLSMSDARDLLLDSVDTVSGLSSYVRTGGRLNVANALGGGSGVNMTVGKISNGSVTSSSVTTSFGVHISRSDASEIPAGDYTVRLGLNGTSCDLLNVTLGNSATIRGKLPRSKGTVAVSLVNTEGGSVAAKSLAVRAKKCASGKHCSRAKNLNRLSESAAQEFCASVSVLSSTSY